MRSLVLAFACACGPVASPAVETESGGAGASSVGGATSLAGTGTSSGGAVRGGAGGTGGAAAGTSSAGGPAAGAAAKATCSNWSGAIAAGRTLLCIGQDTGEIDAYAEALGAPGGAMLYTNVADLAGFDEEVDFGTGRQSLKHWLEQPRPLALQLAVSLTKAQGNDYCSADHVSSIVSGSLDGALSSMALKLAVTARPVLLRFGYEFDNSACRSYEPAGYRQAFRHFAEVFRNLGAVNVKLVWNAWGGPPLDVNAWYPGDDVVDYVGVSVFPVGLEPGKLEAMASFAKAHGKPLMVAESTPQAHNPLSNAQSWAWFASLLDYVARHDVRVLSYINQDWNRQSVWAAQGIWGDSRIQRSAVESMWRSAMSEPRFLHSSDSLYRELGCSP